MKTYVLIPLIGMMLSSCLSGKTAVDQKKGTYGDPMRYFDQDNNPISEAEFRRIRSTNALLDIPGDSVNDRKLILREFRGTVKNNAVLISLLEKMVGHKIDRGKPLVVIYYPGKDACNSGGVATRERLKEHRKELEEGIKQIAHTQPIYIYKDKAGLEKYRGIVNWYPDPENAFERLFFKHHYPCGSFVVISENGNYISYFGEYSTKMVLLATKSLVETTS